MNLPAPFAAGGLPAVLLWVAGQMAVVALLAVAVASCFRRTAAVRRAVLSCGLLGVAMTPLFLLLKSPLRFEIAAGSACGAPIDRRKAASGSDEAERVHKSPARVPLPGRPTVPQDRWNETGGRHVPDPALVSFSRQPAENSDREALPGTVEPPIDFPPAEVRMAEEKRPPVRAPLPSVGRPVPVAVADDPPLRSGRANSGRFAVAREPASEATSALAFASTWFAAVWFAGVLLWGVRLRRSYTLLRNVIREAREIDRPEWHSLLTEVCNDLRLRRRPRLLVSDRIRSPLSAGILRPAVLLPTTILPTITRRALRQVLLHELAHIRRRDHLGLLFQRLVQSLLWPHLCVHLLAKRLGDAREDLCDDVVLSFVEPAEYSRTLLSLTERLQDLHCPSAAVCLLPRRRKLHRRIASLVDERRTVMSRLKLRGTLLVAALMLCLTAGIGLLQYGRARADDSTLAKSPAAGNPAQPDDPAPSRPAEAARSAAVGDPTRPPALNPSSANPLPVLRPARGVSPGVVPSPENIPRASKSGSRPASSFGVNGAPTERPSKTRSSRASRTSPARRTDDSYSNSVGVSRPRTSRALKGIVDAGPGGVSVLGLIEALSDARLKIQTLGSQFEYKNKLAQNGYTTASELRALKLQAEEAQRRFALLYELAKLAFEGADQEYGALRQEQKAGGKVSPRDLVAARYRMRQLGLVLKYFTPAPKPVPRRSGPGGEATRGGNTSGASSFSPGGFRSPSFRFRGSSSDRGTQTEPEVPATADHGLIHPNRPAGQVELSQLELKCLGKTSRLTGSRREVVYHKLLAVLKSYQSSGVYNSSEGSRVWNRLKSANDYLLVTFKKPARIAKHLGVKELLAVFPAGELPRFIARCAPGGTAGKPTTHLIYLKPNDLATLKEFLSLPELALVGRLPAKSGSDHAPRAAGDTIDGPLRPPER